ncbi:lymphocyte antigen 6L [Phodopus roborovskii]|uniref:Ly6l protein n=1 Tax=Phodopus roborovskii TaxID=109678 RepID=A0AAU9ZG58_PHORO|nr:lymphocyte antigen 6L [Phodopus roborovskii]CAH6791023.1 Ly6l [Phodopus roborovskii]
MTQLFLALWASLVSVELARGFEIMTPAPNLSCFQCFKVQQPNQCRPIICQPNEKVCQSNEILLYSNSMSKAQISKRCAVQCSNTNSQFEWTLNRGIKGRITRRCCSIPLCNRAPDTQKRFGARPGRILLPMGLGLFFTLL